jgi:hypothetical protein
VHRAIIAAFPILVSKLWGSWKILPATEYGFENRGLYSVQFEAVLTKEHRPTGSRVSSVDIGTRYELDTEESGLDPRQRQENFIFSSFQTARVLSGREFGEMYFQVLGYIVVLT